MRWQWWCVSSIPMQMQQLCNCKSTSFSEKVTLVKVKKIEHRLFNIAHIVVNIDNREKSDKNIVFGEFMNAILEARWRGGSNFADLVQQLEIRVNVARGQVVSNMFLLLTFLVLVSSSSALFKYYQCDSFKIPVVDQVNGVSKERFLFVDYTIDCDSQRYNDFFFYTLGMIFVYPVIYFSDIIFFLTLTDLSIF